MSAPAPVSDAMTAPPRSLFREVLAVLLLTVGSILPILAWIVGVALLWSSDRWTVRDRLLGTLVWPFGYAGVLFSLTAVPTQSCFSADGGPEVCEGFALSPVLGAVVLAVLVLAPLAVGAWLLVRADRAASRV